MADTIQPEARESGIRRRLPVLPTVRTWGLFCGDVHTSPDSSPHFLCPQYDSKRRWCKAFNEPVSAHPDHKHGLRPTRSGLCLAADELITRLGQGWGDHFHPCPECYEHVPCGMACTTEHNFHDEDDFLLYGSPIVCSACQKSAKVSPSTPESP